MKNTEKRIHVYDLDTVLNLRTPVKLESSDFPEGLNITSREFPFLITYPVFPKVSVSRKSFVHSDGLFEDDNESDQPFTDKHKGIYWDSFVEALSANHPVIITTWRDIDPEKLHHYLEELANSGVVQYALELDDIWSFPHKDFDKKFLEKFNKTLQPVSMVDTRNFFEQKAKLLAEYIQNLKENGLSETQRHMHVYEFSINVRRGIAPFLNAWCKNKDLASATAHTNGATRYFGTFPREVATEPSNIKIPDASPLSELTPLSPVFERFATRFPGEDATDPSYLKNLFDSLILDFEEFYLNPQDYTITLAKQNRHLLHGTSDASSNYSGYSGPRGSYQALQDTQSIQDAGHFRNEPEYEFHPDFPLEMGRVGMNMYQKIIEAYKDFIQETSINEAIQPAPQEIILPISGIPSEHRPKVLVSDELFLRYPTSEALDTYLSNMEKSLVQAIEISKEKDVQTDCQANQQLISHLSHYAQLGAIAHPFKRGNFSIVMSHVNYVLAASGYKPIPHSLLDYAAFLNSSDDFSIIFKDAFDEAQQMNTLDFSKNCRSNPHLH